MPTLSTEAILTELENALAELAARETPVFVLQVKSILLTNLDRGRLHKVIEGDLQQVQRYAHKVADGYRTFGNLLQKLQKERSSAAWTELLEQMQQWTFNYLVRKNFRAEVNTQAIAEELTNEAAIQVLNAYFPFDTHFDAWIHVIVINTCRKYFRSRRKESAIPDSQLVDIEPLHNTLHDNASAEVKRQAELQEIIHAALTQLSEARREVIELTYLQALPIKEAAERMGKSVGALYSLRFYALEGLREILGQKGNNDNEEL